MKISRRYSGTAGIYVCAVPLHGMRKLIDVVTQCLPEDFQLDTEEAHCTLMYSKNHHPNQLVAASAACQGAKQFHAVIDEIKQWPGHDGDGYLVAALSSPCLNARHEHWKRTGAVHSFEDFVPHVTLASGYGQPIPTATIKEMNRLLSTSDIRLVFGGERYEDIKE